MRISALDDFMLLIYVDRPTIGYGLTKTFQAASLYSMGFIIVMMVTMMVIIIKLI